MSRCRARAGGDTEAVGAVAFGQIYDELHVAVEMEDDANENSDENGNGEVGSLENSLFDFVAQSPNGRAQCSRVE